MSTMASQITSFTIVYSSVYSGTDQRKLQSSASLAFVRGIHQWSVNSPHKGPVKRKVFLFDDVIMNILHPHGGNGYKSSMPKLRQLNKTAIELQAWVSNHMQRKHSMISHIHVIISNDTWYGAIIMRPNYPKSHNRLPMARPSGRAMGCLLWVWCLIYVLLLSSVCNTVMNWAAL